MSRIELKRKFVGLVLVILSIGIIAYSVFFMKSGAFWGIYIGFTLLSIGLAMLGYTPGYPF
jgi:uncharacterized membrane protein